MAVTAAKSVMAFRVLTMAVDLCRLTTRTMNVNAGHERTSKARIIHQIQLIRGITRKLSRRDCQKRYLQNVCRPERQTHWDGKRYYAPEIYSGSAPGSENCLL
ncbi:glutamate decarboxylase isozyme [Shigella dysenteriae 1617]|nr:glutamate decarboxylase isozyme [Shigella dysenteriae 1617]